MADKATSDEKRLSKLKHILNRIRHKETVQNRQLRTWLSKEAYEQFENERFEQQKLGKMLKNKPAQIVEYEQRLKKATFSYAKADAASRAGRHKVAQKMSGASDTQFERLLEFLAEIMCADPSLEMWFDRNAIFDATNSPHTSAEEFPCVITSLSLRNKKGGILNSKRTIKRLKEDAVEREIEELTAELVDNNLILERLAAGKKIVQLLKR